MNEKLRRIGREIWDGFVPQFPKLTAEQITPANIADIINGYIIGNPKARIGRPPEDRIFTINTVLQNSGHIPLWSDTDMMQTFPQEYRAARKALFQLVRGGVLTQHELENGPECVGYSVADSDKLRAYIAADKKSK